MEHEIRDIQGLVNDIQDEMRKPALELVDAHTLCQDITCTLCPDDEQAPDCDRCNDTGLCTEGYGDDETEEVCTCTSEYQDKAN